MKVTFHAPALVVNKPIIDAGYENRTITFDAERAARMGDAPEKACSWEKGTQQHSLWMMVYQQTRGAV